MAELIDRLVDSSGAEAAAAEDWLAQLQPASFRGVPFQVDTIDWTAGDNVVMREYPFADLPTVFRMGRGAEELRFSAYVIGDDYHRQRDALMEALTGEGTLMHPTAGAMKVFCAGKYTVREAPTAEGGMARFDLAFVRAEIRRYPTAAAGSRAAAVDAATAAKASAVDDFAATWSLERQPGWVVDQALSRMRASVDGVMVPIADAARVLNDFNSELIGSAQALRSNLEDLVRAPRQLADAVATLFALPAELSQAQARAFQTAFAWAFDLGSKLPVRPFEMALVPPVGEGLVIYGTGVQGLLSPTAPAQLALDALTRSSDSLFEALAIAAWVQATAAVELASYDEAMAMRAQAHGQLTRLLMEASAAAPAPTVPASNLHDALQALHASVLADLQRRSLNLVRLTTYTPEGWQPVWYISYRVYGTAAYADEILRLNPHIRDPLLVPPDVPLRLVRHDS